MDRNFKPYLQVAILLVPVIAGCNSPYHADRGALFGGLLGAGTGAVVGDALGNAGAGAALGAGVGALSGAAIGQTLDEIEAHNRALIEAKLGRQVAPGAVTIGDVIAMTQAGVDDELIANHVRIHGVARPLQANDLIYLQQQGVSSRVVKAMQEPPAKASSPVVIRQPVPAPVVVEQYHYGPPVWHPPYHRYYWRRPDRPGFSWGLSFHN